MNENEKENLLPKKLKISMQSANGKSYEAGTMEWDGDKWFISGKSPMEIKLLIGERGLYFGGKLMTLRDRGLCIPLLRGYSHINVEVIE